jgi:bifunctional DNase/RNase
MKPSRPLTHDLFKSFAETFGITMKEVVINKFQEGVFHAELVCLDGKHEYRIDARTSDAVALSLRFNCPVYTYESIMAKAGIIVDEKDKGIKTEEKTKKPSNIYEQYSVEELENLLKQAVEKEEYEKASKIRDEINRRKELI